MKRLLAVAFIATAAVVALTGTASATVCVTGGMAVVLKYENPTTCMDMFPREPTGEYYLRATWLVNGEELPSSVELLSEEEIGIEDMKGGLFGEAVEILCSMLNKGQLTPPNIALVESLTSLSGGETIECITEKGTCPTPTVKAVNLPWEGQFFVGESEEVRLELHAHSGGAAPGFKIKCSSVEDECVGDSDPLIENLAESNDIDATFDEASNTEPGKCSRGGSEQFLLHGTILFFVHEQTLTANNS